MSQAGRQAVGKRWGEARERTAKAHKVHPQHCCIKPQSDMTSELGHCMNDPPQVHTSSKEFQGPRHKLGLKCASPQTWPCRGREGGREFHSSPELVARVLLIVLQIPCAREIVWKFSFSDLHRSHICSQLSCRCANHRPTSQCYSDLFKTEWLPVCKFRSSFRIVPLRAPFHHTGCE